MAEPLEQQLIFDISPALASIDTLDAALTDVVANFSANLTAAVAQIAAIPLQVDTSQIGTDVEAAIAQVATTPVPVEADTSALDTGIADALDQPRPPVAVEGDTAGLTTAIDDATTGISPVIPVDADTTAAQAALDALITTPIELTATVDTTDATQQLDDLGQAASVAAGGVDSLSGGVEVLKAGTGLASGQVESLGGVISNISPAAAEAVGGMAALAGTIGAITTLAADAQAQNARFVSTFGTLADAVNNINIGGLNIELKDLGAQSGTTNADLEATASRIGQLGKTSGAADTAVVSTTQKLIALGATVAVNNPRLGDAAAVTDRLGNALARGGKSLAPFGIGLTTTQIQLEAFRETGKTTASDLTQFDKVTAGATLAVQQFGGSLGTEFAAGAGNAQVQFRALKISIEESLSALGQPLVAPVLQVLTDLAPIAVSTGGAIGGLAHVAIPLVQSLVTTLGPVAPLLDAFATGLGAVGDTLNGIPGPIRVLAVELGVLALAGRAAATSFVASGLVFASSPFGAAVLGIGAAITALGIFSPKAKVASTDAVALATAFGLVSGSGDKFVSTLGGVETAIDQFLTKELQIGDAGNKAIDATNRIGLSNNDLAKGLRATGPEFDRWEAHITSMAVRAGAGETAANRLFDVLEQGRQSLQDSAAASLAAAISNGALTQSEVDLLIAKNTQKFTTDAGTQSVVDYITVLDKEAGKIDAAARKRVEEAHAAALQSGAFQELANQIAAGTVSSANAAEVAQRLGIAEADATTFINDQVAALTAQSDARILASDSAQRLAGELASGNISAAQAQTLFLQLGVSLPATASAIDAVTQAVNQFVSGVNGALPSVSSAIGDFSKQVDTDWKKIQDDIANGTGNVQADLKTLADDQDPKRFADNLNQQAANIAQFAGSLASLVKQGFGDLAGILAQEGPTAAGGLAAALASEPAKAKIAEASLVLRDTAVSNLDLLLREKFPQLDQLGVDAGGHIISGVGTGIVTGVPAVEAASTQASDRAAAAFDPSFAHRVPVAMQAAAVALATDPSISQAAGEIGLRAVAAFTATFGPVSTSQAATIALAGAHDAIGKDGTLKVAAAGAGTKTSEGYKPDLKPGTQAAIDAAAPVLTNVGKLTTAAGSAGHAVGVGFDSGLVQGLNDPAQLARVTAAAEQVAAAIPGPIRKLLGITSPSLVGITIGSQFIEGVAIGLSNTSSLAGTGSVIVDALTISTTTALGGIGGTITNSIVAGFNDPATLAAATARLEELVARATTSATTGATGAFVSSVVSQIPGASASITQFAQQVSTAASAQTQAFEANHAAYHQYAVDQAAIPPLLARLSSASEVLRTAQVRLFNDTARGLNTSRLAEDAAAVAAAQQSVDAIRSNLSAAQGRIGTDRTNIVTASHDLSAAQTALTAATNPDQFIRNLNRQTVAGRAFQHDLRVLTQEGFTDLAAELAKAGPDAAGKLADGLASNPVKAKAAEKAVDTAKAFAAGFTDFIQTVFAPKAANTGEVLGAQIGSGIATGIASTPLHATVTPHVEPLPQVTIPARPEQLVVAGSPGAPGFFPPAAAHEPLDLTLDLTITLPSGEVVTAAKRLQIPSAQGKQILKAAVDAKVRA